MQSDSEKITRRNFLWRGPLACLGIATLAGGGAVAWGRLRPEQSKRNAAGREIKLMFDPAGVELQTQQGLETLLLRISAHPEQWWSFRQLLLAGKIPGCDPEMDSFDFFVQAPNAIRITGPQTLPLSLPSFYWSTHETNPQQETDSFTDVAAWRPSKLGDRQRNVVSMQEYLSWIVASDNVPGEMNIRFRLEHPEGSAKFAFPVLKGTPLTEQQLNGFTEGLLPKVLWIADWEDRALDLGRVTTYQTVTIQQEGAQKPNPAVYSIEKAVVFNVSSLIQPAESLPVVAASLKIARTTYYISTEVDGKKTIKNVGEAWQVNDRSLSPTFAPEVTEALDKIVPITWEK